MNAIRIRKRLDTITLHVPELGPFLGRQVEIIVLDDEPQATHRLVTRDLLASPAAIEGDPVAETLHQLRADRIRRFDSLPWPGADP